MFTRELTAAFATLDAAAALAVVDDDAARLLTSP